MAIKPRMWTSSMPGAPVMMQSGTESTALFNLFKSTLVGYEGKAFDGRASLGWIVLMEDATRLMIKSNPTYSTAPMVILLTHDNSGATRITTGRGNNGWEVTEITNWNPLWIQRGAGTTAVPWVIVGDERTVYGVIDVSQSTIPTTSASTPFNNTVFGFGDLVRFDAQPCHFIIAKSTASTNTAPTVNGPSFGFRFFAQNNTLQEYCGYMSNGRSGTREAILLSSAYGPVQTSNTGAGFGMAQASVGAGVIWTNMYGLRVKISGAGYAINLGYLRGVWFPVNDVTKLGDLKCGSIVRPTANRQFGALVTFFESINAGDASYASMSAVGIEIERSWDGV